MLILRIGSLYFFRRFNLKIKKLILVCVFVMFSQVLGGKSKKTLVLGVTPVEDREKMIKKFSPLVKYLEEQLKIKINFTISLSYDRLAEDMNKGFVDIASFSPAAYVEAKRKFKKIKYLCTAIDSGTKKDHYLGYIIVKKDSKIKSYKGLKNKLFAFVDKGSGSGYKYPYAQMIKKWKINPKKFFKKTLFLGNHSNVIDSIYKGHAHGGATWNGALKEKEKEYGKNVFRIIYQTPPIPGDAIAVSRKVNYKLRRKLKKLLLSISKNTKNKSGQYITKNFYFAGFSSRKKNFYNVIKETIRILRY